MNRLPLTADLPATLVQPRTGQDRERGTLPAGTVVEREGEATAFHPVDGAAERRTYFLAWTGESAWRYWARTADFAAATQAASNA